MTQTNRTQPVVSSQDYLGVSVIENLPDAVAPQSPVTLSQQGTQLALKQDNVSGGAGVEVTGSSIAVDLAVSGTNYGSLTLSGTSHSSLDGEYTLASFKGSLTYAGTSLDLDVGGNYNVYYKVNGGGVWAVIAKRDTDNVHNNGSTGESNGQWLAVLTTVDVTTISEDYNNLIPNYQAVDSDFVTSSSEQDDNGNGTPSSADSQVTYGSGSTPAGLIFDNDKLAIDFASTTAEAASTKVFPSSVIKTYVEEQRDLAKIASNNTFSNSQANLTGNPGNVQSALESAAGEIDSLASVVSSNQTTAATEYGKIATLETEMNAAEASVVAEAAARASDVAALELTIGVSAGSGVTTAGDNVTSGDDVEKAISDLDVALGLIQGDLSSRMPAVDYFHSGLEFALTSGQLAGTEEFDEAKYNVYDPQTGALVSTSVSDLSTAVQDLKILVSYGPSGDADAGVYVRDTATGYLSRADYFDQPAEVQKNAIMQVKYGGSIAGAQFYVATPDDPTIGTDPIGFELASAVIIGQGTIDEPKLETALAAKVNAKSDKFIATVTTDSSGFVTIAHDLATSDFIAQAWSTVGEGETVPSIEFSDASSASVVLGGIANTTYKVVLIG